MNGALNDSRFWAAHYYLLLADDEHDSAELIQPLFGISAEKLYEYYFNELVKPDGQATPIWLPLGNGYQVGVEYADCGEDGHEVRYFLGHSDGSAPELLGFDSPHFALPAFRWQELVHFRNVLGPELGNLAATLLFAGTYITDADDLEEVVSLLSSWWVSHPILPTSRSTLVAQNAAGYRHVSGFRWWRDEKLGWVNDCAYSLRNPSTRMRPFSAERFDRVQRFLTAFGFAA